MDSNVSIIPIGLGFVRVFLIKGPKGCILVDTGLTGNEGRILKGMKTAGIEPGDVGLIVITHAHGDHTGGLTALAKATGAKVMVHRADLGYVASGTSAPVVPRNTGGKVAYKLLSGKPVALAPFVPDIVIDGDTDLTPYGIKARVIHTPGHTEGSISIITGVDSTGGEPTAALVGDTIGGGFVLQGRPGLPMFAQDEAKLRRSVDRLKSMAPPIILCAHGGPFRLDRIMGI